jgi:hypothetical protein
MTWPRFTVLNAHSGGAIKAESSDSAIIESYDWHCWSHTVSHLFSYGWHLKIENRGS